MASAFDCSPASLPDHPSVDNVEGWDSLNHLKLILAVEQAFNIRFSTAKIPDLTSFEVLLEEIKSARH